MIIKCLLCLPIWCVLIWITLACTARLTEKFGSFTQDEQIPMAVLLWSIYFVIALFIVGLSLTVGFIIWFRLVM